MGFGLPGKLHPVDFSRTISHEDDTITVSVAGEWDFAATLAFESELDRCVDEAPVVVLDLSGLTFIDSTAIGAILSANTRARERDVELRLIPGSPAVQRPFEIAGLTEPLNFAS